MYIIFNILPSRYNDVIIYCKRPILNDLGTELRSKMAARFRVPKSEDEERLLLSKVGESAVEDVDFQQFDVSDEVLASMPLPDSSGSNNGENKVFLNSVLNNCNINIVFRK